MMTSANFSKYPALIKKYAPTNTSVANLLISSKSASSTSNSSSHETNDGGYATLFKITSTNLPYNGDARSGCRSDVGTSCRVSHASNTGTATAWTGWD